jgi:hypothetical protein
MRFWGKVPPWAILYAMAIGGFCMISAPKIWGWEWDYGIVHDLGIAIFIAALLGVTIDRWLKAEIARDVFMAALGYILPEEFHQEIRRIANFKFLSERQVSVFQIEDIGNSTVRLTSMIERTLRNISDNSETLNAYISMDEWGFDEPSQILECRLEMDGRTLSDFTKRITAHEIIGETDKIDLLPGRTASLFYKTTEIKRNNDDISGVYLSPTRNPEIQVQIPNTLEYSVEFGRHDYKTQKDRYSERYILQGTYFPSQHMRIRWWPKRDG